MAHRFCHILLAKAITGTTQNQEVGKQTLPATGKAAKHYGHFLHSPLLRYSIPYVHECIECSQAYLGFWLMLHCQLKELQVI